MAIFSQRSPIKAKRDGEDRQENREGERMDAEGKLRGRERPVAHTRQGVILTRGAHSLITGSGLKSAGVRPDPNPQWQVQMGFCCLSQQLPYTTRTHTYTNTFCKKQPPLLLKHTRTHETIRLHMWEQIHPFTQILQTSLTRQSADFFALHLL